MGGRARYPPRDGHMYQAHSWKMIASRVGVRVLLANFLRMSVPLQCRPHPSLHNVNQFRYNLERVDYRPFENTPKTQP